MTTIGERNAAVFAKLRAQLQRPMTPMPKIPRQDEAQLVGEVLEFVFPSSTEEARLRLQAQFFALRDGDS